MTTAHPGIALNITGTTPMAMHYNLFDRNCTEMQFMQVHLITIRGFSIPFGIGWNSNTLTTTDTQHLSAGLVVKHSGIHLFQNLFFPLKMLRNNTNTLKRVFRSCDNEVIHR